MNHYEELVTGTSGDVSLWMLNDTGGSAVDNKDSNTGTYGGTYTQSESGPSGVGNSTKLTKEKVGGVTVPDSANLKITGKLFIGAWIYPNTFSFENTDTILLKSTSEKYDAADYLFQINQNGFLEYTSNFAVSKATVKSRLNVVAESWYHVAVVHDTTAEWVWFYINGYLAGGEAWTHAISTSAGQVFIGQQPTFIKAITNGKLAGVYIGEGTPNGKTIGGHYDAGVSVTPPTATSSFPKKVLALPGLKGYWRLNEKEGTLVHDSTSGGRSNAIYQTNGGTFKLGESGFIEGDASSGSTLFKGNGKENGELGSAKSVSVLPPSQPNLPTSERPFYTPTTEGTWGAFIELASTWNDLESGIIIVSGEETAGQQGWAFEVLGNDFFKGNNKPRQLALYTLKREAVKRQGVALSETQLTRSKPYFVVATFKKGVPQFYIDGSPDTTYLKNEEGSYGGPEPEEIENSTSAGIPPAIGSAGGPLEALRGFNGREAEIFFGDQAISEKEVKELWEATMEGKVLDGTLALTGHLTPKTPAQTHPINGTLALAGHLSPKGSGKKQHANKTYLIL